LAHGSFESIAINNDLQTLSVQWTLHEDNFIGSDLKPSPKFELVAEAHDAYAREVTEPKDVPEALSTCVEAVVDEKRAALLNVKCGIT